MKVRKYPELNKLKGRFRELGLSYRKVSSATDIPLNRLNDKVNGYSQVGLEEALSICEVADIAIEDIPIFFEINVAKRNGIFNKKQI